MRKTASLFIIYLLLVLPITSLNTFVVNAAPPFPTDCGTDNQGNLNSCSSNELNKLQEEWIIENPKRTNFNDPKQVSIFESAVKAGKVNLKSEEGKNAAKRYLETYPNGIPSDKRYILEDYLQTELPSGSVSLDLSKGEGITVKDGYLLGADGQRVSIGSLKEDPSLLSVSSTEDGKIVLKTKDGSIKLGKGITYQRQGSLTTDDGSEIDLSGQPNSDLFISATKQGPRMESESGGIFSINGVDVELQPGGSLEALSQKGTKTKYQLTKGSVKSNLVIQANQGSAVFSTNAQGINTKEPSYVTGPGSSITTKDGSKGIHTLKEAPNDRVSFCIDCTSNEMQSFKDKENIAGSARYSSEYHRSTKQNLNTAEFLGKGLFNKKPDSLVVSTQENFKMHQTIGNSYNKENIECHGCEGNVGGIMQGDHLLKLQSRDPKDPKQGVKILQQRTRSDPDLSTTFGTIEAYHQSQLVAVGGLTGTRGAGSVQTMPGLNSYQITELMNNNKDLAYSEAAYKEYSQHNKLKGFSGIDHKETETTNRFQELQSKKNNPQTSEPNKKTFITTDFDVESNGNTIKGSSDVYILDDDFRDNQGAISKSIEYRILKRDTLAEDIENQIYSKFQNYDRLPEKRQAEIRATIESEIAIQSRLDTQIHKLGAELDFQSMYSENIVQEKLRDGLLRTPDQVIPEIVNERDRIEANKIISERVLNGEDLKSIRQDYAKRMLKEDGPRAEEASKVLEAFNEPMRAGQFAFQQITSGEGNDGKGNFIYTDPLTKEKIIIDLKSGSSEDNIAAMEKAILLNKIDTANNLRSEGRYDEARQLYLEEIEKYSEDKMDSFAIYYQMSDTQHYLKTYENPNVDPSNIHSLMSEEYNIPEDIVAQLASQIEQNERSETGNAFSKAVKETAVTETGNLELASNLIDFMPLGMIGSMAFDKKYLKSIKEITTAIRAGDKAKATELLKASGSSYKSFQQGSYMGTKMLDIRPYDRPIPPDSVKKLTKIGGPDSPTIKTETEVLTFKPGDTAQLDVAIQNRHSKLNMEKIGMSNEQIAAENKLWGELQSAPDEISQQRILNELEESSSFGKEKAAAFRVVNQKSTVDDSRVLGQLEKEDVTYTGPITKENVEVKITSEVDVQVPIYQEQYVQKPTEVTATGKPEYTPEEFKGTPVDTSVEEAKGTVTVIDNDKTKAGEKVNIKTTNDGPQYDQSRNLEKSKTPIKYTNTELIQLQNIEDRARELSQHDVADKIASARTASQNDRLTIEMLEQIQRENAAAGKILNVDKLAANIY